MCGPNWENIMETPSKQEDYGSESVNTSSVNDSRVIEENQNRGGLKPQQADQPTLGEAVRVLFDFMDKEIDVKNYAKKSTLRSLQNKVEAIVYQEKKHATTQCELRRVGRKSIRRIAQAQVVEESDSDSEEDVSAFDMFKNTPAFKQQMMVTRSQKKSTKKRMRKSMPALAAVIMKEVQQEIASDAEITEFGRNKRELRSRKRRLN